MRRHAKALTAGSTQRQADGLGQIVRGALAIRGASCGSKGSGAPSARALLLPLTLLASLLFAALGAGSALAAAPTIPVTTVSAVTAKTAVLEADVNPEGEATTYHFEYGLTDCSSNPCTSVPVPDANVGSASTARRMTRELSGLQPETTYHLRVVATNASGTTEGPDATFTTYPLPSATSGCANQAFRFGAGANLPDCRAYEMVSPVDKNGGDIITACSNSCTRTALNQSALSGDKFTFSSLKSFGTAPSARYSNQYMATRGPAGWTTDGIDAPQGLTLSDQGKLPFTYELNVTFKAFTADLSSGWLFDTNAQPLTANAESGIVQLYRRDNTNGSYESLINTPPLIPERAVSEIQGVSADGSHAVFMSFLALTPDALPGETKKVYDFHDGQIDLVSVLPDGTASPGYSVAGAIDAKAFDDERTVRRMHAVSDDGSRIFWTAGNDLFSRDGPLYVRIDDTTTVAVSEDEHTRYWTASADGSKVIYDDGPDSETEPTKLYVFDVDSETTTLVTGESLGVAGASEDLSYVYYVSKEAVDAGAIAGEPNLYLYKEGASTFIANLSRADAGRSPSGLERPVPSLVSREPLSLDSRVTADGRHLAFMSARSLTGYDNTDAINGEPDLEVFRYAADSQQLTCVSCNPSGARPVGHRLRLPYTAKRTDNDTFDNGVQIWSAAWISTQENGLYAPRLLSEDGNRIFFNSFDALVPRDNNGRQDVYEWQAQGTGSCQKAGGCIDLISSGESSEDSEFVDASPDGDDVFISTSASLLPQDPGLIDIYNARVNGGYPPPPAGPTPCEGDACQGAPSPLNDPTPASSSFHGPGDLHEKKARRCKAPKRQGKAKSAKQAKASKQAQRKRAKSCRRANRRAGR